MKNLSQDSRPPGQYLNPGPTEYEAGVLTNRLRRLVMVVGMVVVVKGTEDKANVVKPDMTLRY
jgi:hypothetical protein